MRTLLLSLLVLSYAHLHACELLVKAVDYTHQDPEKDRRGSYKRGMIVEVREDGASYGTDETLPLFVVIKIPLVPAEKVLKYIEPQRTNVLGELQVYRRREWQFQWASFPLAIRNKLANTGTLIIKASPDYNGPYDVTWAAVKAYIRNLRTGNSENSDL